MFCKSKLSQEETILADTILEALKQSCGCFGVMYLQLKYKLGYAKAVRIIDYIIEHNDVEEGNFGTETLKAPDGMEYECVMKYRLL